MKLTNYDDLLRLLDEYLHSQKELIIYWEDGLIIKGYSFTGREETVCLLEEDDPLYEDGVYYWAGVMVLEVIQQARGKADEACAVGEGVGVEPWDAPSKVTTVDGEVLWVARNDRPDWRL